LHYFPEGSTIWSKFKNEIQFIDQIQSSKNPLHDLIVIDHPTFFLLPERPQWIINYYKRLHGVFYFDLISKNGIPESVILNSNTVYSINGSIVFEALSLGRNAVIFDFHPLLCIENCNLFFSIDLSNYPEFNLIFSKKMSANNFDSFVKTQCFYLEDTMKALNAHIY